MLRSTLGPYTLTVTSTTSAPPTAGNMMLFDSEGKIRRYESPEAILEEFAILRLEYYHKRKLSLLAVRTLTLP